MTPTPVEIGVVLFWLIYLILLFCEEKENKPGQAAVTFKAYTVVAGDNLWKICAAHDLDYGANYKIILAMNGIQDANQIYVGQTILLPIVNES